MGTKIKYIVVSILFVTVIGGFLMASVISPSIEISTSERRRLAQRPEFSWTSLWSGELFDDLGDYIVDQFFMRDLWRAVAAFGTTRLLGMRDNNGIYRIGDYVFSMDWPLNENNIIRAADRFNRVYARYFAGGDFNVFYSVIPDRNYFVAHQHRFLAYDYARLLYLLHQNVNESFTYIDIFDLLTLQDFYRTDLHWRQNRLSPVVERLLTGMGREYTHPQHTAHTMYPFRGSYFGQAAMPFLRPDTMTFLSNETIDNARAYVHNFVPGSGFVRTQIPIYDIKAFGGVDPFNLFLGGPQMIVEIENPANPDGGELFIFRDSFGSSLAPLLIENYSRITLIDMRYIRYELYEQFITFTPGNDVLFIHNTQILNHSVMFQ